MIEWRGKGEEKQVTYQKQVTRKKEHQSRNDHAKHKAQF